MKMEQVSNHCYAVLNEKNRVCDANSGYEMHTEPFHTLVWNRHGRVATTRSSE